MMSIEYFDFSIATGANRAVDCRADFVRYMTGSAGGGDESIIVKAAQGGVEVKLKPGQSFKIDQPQNRWYLQGVSGNTVIGEVLFANGGEFDDATVAGTVSIIDGGKNRTAGNTAFILPIEQLGVAAQMPHVQFWNPVASGKNAFVKKIFVTALGASGQFQILDHAAALGASIANGRPKKLGGTVSVMESHRLSAAAASGTNVLFLGGMNAGTSVPIEFTEPVQVPPGYGIIVMSFVLAAGIDATFEYFEETI